MAKWTKETAPLGARGAKPAKGKPAKAERSGSTVVHVHHHYHGAAQAPRKAEPKVPKP